MDTTRHQTPRPLVINLAITLLMVNVTIAHMQNALRADWSTLFPYIKFIMYVALFIVPLWFIWRGRNWARWLLVACAFGGLCVSFPGLIQHIQARSTSWVVTFCWRNLIDVIGLVLLFHPVSSRWLQATENAVPA